jgi:hypothetical protein
MAEPSDEEVHTHDPPPPPGTYLDRFGFIVEAADGRTGPPPVSKEENALELRRAGAGAGGSSGGACAGGVAQLCGRAGRWFARVRALSGAPDACPLRSRLNKWREMGACGDGGAFRQFFSRNHEKVKERTRKGCVRAFPSALTHAALIIPLTRPSLSLSLCAACPTSCAA